MGYRTKIKIVDKNELKKGVVKKDIIGVRVGECSKCNS